MAEIKAIETEYDGYKFRSRLEARWAVFFDTLGVEYEYEPEGFLLPSGAQYLPDFKVMCYGTRGICGCKPFPLWIEVKGFMTQSDADKIKEFAGKVINDEYSMSYWEIINPILIVGNIPPKNEYCPYGGDGMNGLRIYPYNYELIDGDWFGAYPAAHNGKFYLFGDDSNYINQEDIPAILHAYDMARQARFEHGEKPKFIF